MVMLMQEVKGNQLVLKQVEQREEQVLQLTLQSLHELETASR